MPHTPPFEAFRRIKIVVAVLVALAAIAAFSSPGNAAVFGADQRRPLDAAIAPLSDKIGALTSQKTGIVCTAFCVAPDMIATASHCLFGTAASRGPRLSDLRFKIGADRKRISTLADTQSLSQDQTIISGTQQLAIAPPIGAAQDWAVARIEKPLCTSGVIRLSTRSEIDIANDAARGAMYQVAVHADLPGAALRVSGPCAVRQEFPSANRAALARDFMALDNIVFHDCDTGGGSSGSPLLVDTPRGPEAVAMNVGTYVRARSVPSARVPDDATSTPASEALANTAITLGDLSLAMEQLSQSDTLTSNADIRRLKNLLHDAGFYNGAFNSDVTAEMREAVHRFNAVYGRASSSRLTPQLAADLEGWLRARAPETAAR